jgi:hypothetical protein
MNDAMAGSILTIPSSFSTVPALMPPDTHADSEREVPHGRS